MQTAYRTFQEHLQWVGGQAAAGVSEQTAGMEPIFTRPVFGVLVASCLARTAGSEHRRRTGRDPTFLKCGRSIIWLTSLGLHRSRHIGETDCVADAEWRDTVEQAVAHPQR